MESKYRIIFNTSENLYVNNAPLIIKAGALVQNIENGNLHIQLKFQNITDKIVSMIKVKITLMDLANRVLGQVAEQYLDLNCERDKDCGSKIPVFIKETVTRKFTVQIMEVCFSDGVLWTGTDETWTAIPKQLRLETKFTTIEAQREYKDIFSKDAEYLPKRYGDIWLCSCGAVNKLTEKNCCHCKANLKEMEEADNDELYKENIYKRACSFAKSDNVEKLKTAVELFEKIKGYKDVDEKAQETQDKLSNLVRNIEKQKATDRKAIIIFSSFCIALFVAIMIISSISCSNKKKQDYLSAQKYLEENEYYSAMVILNRLGQYKDADELYTYAKDMSNHNFKKIIDRDKLTSFTIPDKIDGKKVTKIEEKAFYECTTLTSITIPNSVTSIGKNAFYLCRNLTSVTIPNSVLSIGSSAFVGCYKLVEVINKSTLNITKGNEGYGEIGYYALTIHKGATKIVNKDGYLFITENGKNYLLGYSGTATDLTLPNIYNGKGYEIYKNAFSYCTNLTSITIPDSVASIGNNAFYNCSSLTSITIPNSVTSIGYSAFEFCSSLTSITIPNSVTSIGDDVFYKCSSLTSITIPDSVTSIGNSAFSGCSSLKSVTIPNSVTSIGQYAFRNCSSLTITFNDSTTWYRTDSSTNWKNKTGGIETDVTNASTNATYFKSMYYDYYWYKL